MACAVLAVAIYLLIIVALLFAFPWMGILLLLMGAVALFGTSLSRLA